MPLDAPIPMEELTSFAVPIVHYLRNRTQRGQIRWFPESGQLVGYADPYTVRLYFEDDQLVAAELTTPGYPIESASGRMLCGPRDAGALKEFTALAKEIIAQVSAADVGCEDMEFNNFVAHFQTHGFSK